MRIALGLAGMKWDTEVVDLLKTSHKSDSHLARNPQGLVPVLEVDGESLTQSLAIVEYLNETRQMGWLPEDPLAKERVRSLSYAIAMEIHPVCNLSVAKWAVAQSGGHLSMEGWMRHFIASGLQAFENMLEGGDYSNGDGLTLADICLAPQIYNARHWGVDLGPMPKIMRVQETLEAIPAFQNAYPKDPAQG